MYRDVRQLPLCGRLGRAALPEVQEARVSALLLVAQAIDWLIRGMYVRVSVN